MHPNPEGVQKGRAAAMPAMVREGLFIGDIRDAAEIISNGSTEITHILSLLSSAYITFFSEWRRGFQAQTKEVEKVYKEERQNPTANGSSSSDEENQAATTRGKLLYNLELVGPELNILRMGVPLRDMENENLLDYLDTCLDFIERGCREGAILVHCFAGVSRSASVVTAYLMKTEQLSQEDALESLRQQSESVCPNDGFLEQLKMFEEMGFKVDHTSSIYKKFHLKILAIKMNKFCSCQEDDNMVQEIYHIYRDGKEIKKKKVARNSIYLLTS